MRVSFFVAGMQKSGTTALDRYLRTHPGIEMASKKEAHFFDDDRLDWSAPDYAGLHAHFSPGSAGKMRGEATPVYAYWPRCLERIQQYNPDARLIVCLRHPAYRAFSHWKMEVMRETETLPFAEAVSAAGRSRVSAAPEGVHRVFSYVERGLYAAQVARILALFPRRQVLFIKTDDLWRDAGSCMNRVCAFLGLPAMASPDHAYTVPVDSSSLGGLPAGERKALDGLFRDDIVATSVLAGLDLKDWLRSDYSEMPSKG